MFGIVVGWGGCYSLRNSTVFWGSVDDDLGLCWSYHTVVSCGRGGEGEGMKAGLGFYSFLVVVGGARFCQDGFELGGYNVHNVLIS